jgi:hypothetical protein
MIDSKMTLNKGLWVHIDHESNEAFVGVDNGHQVRISVEGLTISRHNVDEVIAWKRCPKVLEDGTKCGRHIHPRYRVCNAHLARPPKRSTALEVATSDKKWTCDFCGKPIEPGTEFLVNKSVTEGYHLGHQPQESK